MVKEISIDELKEWMKEGGVQLIDVRGYKQHESCRIPSADSAPISEIEPSCVSRESDKVVLYCQKGITSKRACAKLLAEDSTLEICSLKGGLDAWKAAGFPVVVEKKEGISIERQVQVAIGCLILCSAILTFAVSTQFVWLTLFFGTGLFIAGLTGYCGMGILLNKMPWNKS